MFWAHYTPNVTRCRTHQLAALTNFLQIKKWLYEKEHHKVRHGNSTPNTTMMRVVFGGTLPINSNTVDIYNYTKHTEVEITEMTTK